jgi:hypothetical protein
MRAEIAMLSRFQPMISSAIHARLDAEGPFQASFKLSNLAMARP